jgi:hypothetical protein
VREGEKAGSCTEVTRARLVMYLLRRRKCPSMVKLDNYIEGKIREERREGIEGRG